MAHPKAPKLNGFGYCAAHLRTVILRPYRKGYGPSFTLQVWDTHTTDEMGKSRLAYRLTMREGTRRAVIFQGNDFFAPRFTSIDSNEVVRSLLGFLTLRPGDTDAEYFEGYTARQLAYCSNHAESLGMAVIDRFGEG